LDAKPAAETNVSAPGSGAAQAAGGPACGQREADGGQHEERGEL